MKKIRNIVLGGIQQKVFNLVLVTVILMMAAYGIMIIAEYQRLSGLVEETGRMQKDSATEISRMTMDAVLDANMTQNVQMQAYIAGDYFGDVAGVVDLLADFTGHLFSEPEAYAPRSVSPPVRSGDGESCVQLLTEEGVDLTDPVIASKLGLIGNLSDMMTALYSDAEVDSCYVALPEGVMLLVDDHPSSKFDSDGELIRIPIRERAWYRGAVETGDLYFTDVTTDLFTGQISLMCSRPVYQGGELAAVIGADLFLGDVATAVENLSHDGGFICIVNESGHVIFSPETEGVFRARQADEAEDLRASDNSALADFIREALSGNTGLCALEADGREYYMAGAPIEKVGWTVLSVVPKEVADQPTVMMTEKYDAIQSESIETYNLGLERARSMILVLIAGVVVIAGTAAIVLTKRIVKPLDTITRRVQSLGGDNLQFNMDKDLRTGDEIEVLAEAFAMLSSRTRQYIAEVERVTAEKERIGTELALATRIQADMLPNIYPAFPDRSEFDIYASMDPAKEVGGDFYDFFLIDDDHLCMVMADVSGKGVPAALFMMASKIILDNNAMMGKSPAQVLTDANSAICANNREEMFVTAWLGVLELSTGKLIAANAGHEYPAMKKPGGEFELIRDKHGFVIGGMDGVQYREYEIQLEPGTKLFLYTDGVPEATSEDNELFGNERMLEALNAMPDAMPVQILKNVQSAVDAFVMDATQFDDLTMLCVEYRGPETGDPAASRG